jgi:hypothetical protein
MQSIMRPGVMIWSLLLAIAIAISPIAVHAQNASFTGHVTDSTGAIVPNARVVVRDQSTNVVSVMIRMSAHGPRPQFNE